MQWEYTVRPLFWSQIGIVHIEISWMLTSFIHTIPHLEEETQNDSLTFQAILLLKTIINLKATAKKLRN